MRCAASALAWEISMNVRLVCVCVGGTILATAAMLGGCGDTSSPGLISGYDASTGSDASGGGDASASDASPTDGGSDSGSIVLGGDGGSPGDAGPGGNTSAIPCGATSCSIPSEQCCVYTNQNPPPDFSYACSSGGVCPGLDAGPGDQPSALKCSSAANCPSGTVCCVSQSGGNAVASDCQASCGGNSAQLCDPGVSSAASGCGDAGACSSSNIGDWGLPRTFGTCGGVGN